MLRTSQSEKSLHHPTAFVPGAKRTGVHIPPLSIPLTAQHREPGSPRLSPPPSPGWKSAHSARNAPDPVRLVAAPQRRRGLLRSFFVALRKWIPKPISVFNAVGQMLHRYNLTVAAHDNEPVDLATLEKRIAKRQYQLKTICDFTHNKSVGADSARLSDRVNELHQEQRDLQSLEALLPRLRENRIEPNLSLQDLLQLRAENVGIESILLGMQQGLSTFEIRYIVTQYKAWGVPFNERTYPGPYSDAMVVKGSERPLGRGVMSQVRELEYDTPEGQRRRMVFKPVAVDTMADDRDNWGIPDDPEHLNLPGRAVATSVMAKGSGPVAAEHIPFTAMTVRQGELGTLMDYVPGESARHSEVEVQVRPALARWLQRHPQVLDDYAHSQGYASAEVELKPPQVVFKAHKVPVGRWATVIVQPQNFGDPVLRRDLTRVQWLDVLAGQSDRHIDNYRVQKDRSGQVTGVVGIDHDLSCWVGAGVFTHSEMQAHLRDIQRDYPGGVPVLPRVIDAELRQEILNRDPQALAKDLTPYLSPAEVRARVAALVRVQALLGPDSEQPVDVIDKLADWGTDETAAKLGMQELTKPPTPQQVQAAELAGYVARDHLYLQNQQLTFPYVQREKELKQALQQTGLSPEERSALSQELARVVDVVRGNAVSPVFDADAVRHDLAALPIEHALQTQDSSRTA